MLQCLHGLHVLSGELVLRCQACRCKLDHVLELIESHGISHWYSLYSRNATANGFSSSASFCCVCTINMMCPGKGGRPKPPPNHKKARVSYHYSVRNSTAAANASNTKSTRHASMTHHESTKSHSQDYYHRSTRSSRHHSPAHPLLCVPRRVARM